MVDDVRNESGHFMEQNCRPDWPLWTCIFANVCGYCSTTLWFLVLLPQVWKNFRRKSVKGLSVLWATANFTASLINLFFVFLYATIPLYGQISSVYCPILEFTLLIQFWVYGKYRKLHKLLYVCACVILWATIITVELIFSVKSLVEYAAIILWCIETFPQVILNMGLQSTNGQATGSVCIAMLGKTTDFFSNTFLVMPIQYIIMVYFSSSVAYVNGFQVAWYYGNDDAVQSVSNMKKSDRELPCPQGVENPAFDNQPRASSAPGYMTKASSTSDQLALLNTRQCTRVYACRIVSMVVLSALLLMCVVGFVWNIQSFFGLFAPVSIVLILSIAYLYFSKCKRYDYNVQNID